ncbi:MAG TPA: hypothetical protein DEP35_14495 [Deltaproteobacteria bacterium]|nr:hypothetical protein [Deltaproteobacteria bacterium]
MGNINYQVLTLIPEPSTIVLLGAAVAGVVLSRRRKRS